jgi:MoxR-like ATPase
MIIKTNNKGTYLINPIEAQQFFGVTTDKYVVIDAETNDFVLQEENIFITQSEWVNEEVDGRRFRKIKKDIISEFGDNLLKEYAQTDKIYETLKKKFINTSGVSEVLKNAISNNMNVILFGKGGFGKSEMCGELFGCNELKNRVFIKSLSEATTEEDLFGGINIKKMTESGVIEYNCENSFANKEIVIFEEIFDANPRVLAALKDAITSKEIRNGNQRFPMKTKIIIGLTNKTYDEVIQDDSTEALTQRFPVAYKLEYKMTKLDVAGLILNRYNNYDGNKLAAIVDTIGEMKELTPRKVLELAKYLKDLNVRKNRIYSEKITNNVMTPVIDYLKSKTNINYESLLFGEIVSTIREIKNEKINDYDMLLDFAQNADIIKYSQISNIATPSMLNLEIDTLVNHIKNVA